MRGEHERKSALSLAHALQRAGVADARASGGGLHWQVDAGTEASRSLVVHCFWYARAVTGLMLGMNPANSRSRLRAAAAPREGPEYFAILRDGPKRIADGRTADAAAVITCARAWLAGVDLEQVVVAAPFVHEQRRRTLAFAAQIDPRLPRSVAGDPSYELWVYGDFRSCMVLTGDSASRCCMHIGQAQVAVLEATGHADLADLVHRWLLDRVSLHDLAARFPEVVLEDHAELIEVDPARWHWAHVLDRLRDPGDVLAPLSPLIERLAESPVASRFYSYSSLNRFCFSASSHFPWVDEGLPVIAPDTGGACLVDDAGSRESIRCDVERAVELVEARLRASTLEPFFGSAPHHELPRLTQRLRGLGSSLSPRTVQQGAWYRLVVASSDGARSCEVSDRVVTLREGDDELTTEWTSLDEAAQKVRDHCERLASMDEIAGDPRATYVKRRKLPSAASPHEEW